MQDKQGRSYAKLSELKAGDEIELDGGFTCASGRKVLKATPHGLAFDCKEGEAAHVISGQADDGEHCVGIYLVIVHDDGREVSVGPYPKLSEAMKVHGEGVAEAYFGKRN